MKKKIEKLIDVAAEAAHIDKRIEATVLAHLTHIEISLSSIENAVQKSNDLNFEFHLLTMRAATVHMQQMLLDVECSHAFDNTHATDKEFKNERT